MSDAKGLATFFLFLVVSLFLGILLTFPLVSVIAQLCLAFGLTETQCINTNDRTVWHLADPLLIFPIYIICMYVGRASCRKKGTDG